jgi:hypothetical protein
MGRTMTHLRVAGAAAALVIAVLGGLLAFTALDDARAHRDATREAQRARGLGGQVAALSGERDQLSAQLTSLRTQNTALQSEARSPTLPMWNACAGPCAVGPNTVRVGSVPDTFQLLLAFTADVPVRSYIFTFHQWTQYDTCGFAVRCVTGAYQAFDPATSVDTTFADAEGCSAYVWVIQADRDGTIKPDVRVRYQPADQPTGVCAGS